MKNKSYAIYIDLKFSYAHVSGTAIELLDVLHSAASRLFNWQFFLLHFHLNCLRNTHTHTHIRMSCSVYCMYKITFASALQTHPRYQLNSFQFSYERLSRFIEFSKFDFCHSHVRSVLHSNPIFLSYHTHHIRAYTLTHTLIAYTFAINLFSIYHFTVTIK